MGSHHHSCISFLALATSTTGSFPFSSCSNTFQMQKERRDQMKANFLRVSVDPKEFHWSWVTTKFFSMNPSHLYPGTADGSFFPLCPQRTTSNRFFSWKPHVQVLNQNILFFFSQILLIVLGESLFPKPFKIHSLFNFFEAVALQTPLSIG